MPGAEERRIGRIFQFASFVADVPQIAIATVDLLAAGFDWDRVLFGVVETVLPRFQIPFTPWRDDPEFWGQSLIGQFKPDLVVAFSRAPVS